MNSAEETPIVKKEKNSIVIVAEEALKALQQFVCWCGKKHNNPSGRCDDHI